MKETSLVIEKKDNITVLKFLCELDAPRAIQMQGLVAQTLETDPQSLVVDISSVTFLDSHGVGLFAKILKHAYAKGGVLAFCGANGQPRSVLNMVGFDDVVHYYDNVDTALQAIQNQA